LRPRPGFPTVVGLAVSPSLFYRNEEISPSLFYGNEETQDAVGHVVVHYVSKEAACLLWQCDFMCVRDNISIISV